MHIDAYTFGSMVIDGTSYTSDLIIYPDRVEPDWWRQQGHFLSGDDIAFALKTAKPDHIVVGTGKFGMMKIDRDLIGQLSASRITLHAAATKRAVEIYNRLAREKKNVLGTFHLTC